MGFQEGMSSYITPGPAGIQVQIERHDNGYQVSYFEPPKPPPPIAPEDMPPVPDPDEMMDSVLDGVGAILRRLHDENSGGEDWKGSEDREKLRKGFRLMFPNLESQLRREYQLPQRPIQKSLVFSTREALIDFLTKALPA